jgi:hypothetical protein
VGGRLLGRPRLLGRRLLGRLGLLGGDVTAQALAIGLATGAVGLGVLDARGVALDADAERFAKVERFFVGESELSCELVDPDPLGQSLFQSLPAYA